MVLASEESSDIRHYRGAEDDAQAGRWEVWVLIFSEFWKSRSPHRLSGALQSVVFPAGNLPKSAQRSPDLEVQLSESGSENSLVCRILIVPNLCSTR